MSKKKNYGGAFDIDPEMYWSGDDLQEFIFELIHLIEKDYGPVSIESPEIDVDNNISMLVETADQVVSLSTRIDLRRAPTPQKLKSVYAPELAQQFFDKVKTFSEDSPEI